MDNPRKQHYIPQFYLKGFSNNSKTVWVYHKSKNTIKEQGIRDTTAIMDMYTGELFGHQNYDIEKLLHITEKYTGIVIRRIEAKVQLVENDLQILMYFIAYLYVRTPKFIDQYNKVTDIFTKDYFKHRIPNVATMQSMIEDCEKGTGKTIDMSAKELFEFAQSNRYTAKTNKEVRLLIMIILGSELYHDLRNFCCFFVPNFNNRFYITSDSPIAIINSTSPDLGIKEDIGIRESGSVILVPLSKKICLMLTKDKENKFVHNLSPDRMNIINRFIFLKSKDYVISNDKQEIDRLIHH